MLLHFLRFSLTQTYQQNKQVKKMYVTDIYSVKQPQNIIIKVKINEHMELEKKNTTNEVLQVHF